VIVCVLCVKLLFPTGYKFNQALFTPCKDMRANQKDLNIIERFHSPGDQTCKFIETKGNVNIRKKVKLPQQDRFGTTTSLF